MVMITDVSMPVMNGLLYVEARGLHTAIDTSETPGSAVRGERSTPGPRCSECVKEVCSYAFIGPAQARRKRVE